MCHLAFDSAIPKAAKWDGYVSRFHMYHAREVDQMAMNFHFWRTNSQNIEGDFK